MKPFQFRGFLYDLARSQRTHMGHLRRLVEGLSELGYNLLVINLEHRFAFPGCPGLCPPDGMTPAQARELCAFALKKGVEVVPCVSVAGHCEGLAATERYAHLSADPFQHGPWAGYEMLNLDLPEARELARRMIRGAVEAFPGKRLHVGLDEVRRLPWLHPGDEPRQLEKLGIFFRFILEEGRKTGRELMMWGDIPLKHPSLLDALPKDVVICDWHYNPEGSRETLQMYRDRGFRVLACPSTDTCYNFATSPMAHLNIGKMVSDAYELGLEGFLLTTWQHGMGSGPDLSWPRTAMAARLARGERVGDPDCFDADFASERYGVKGERFVRLQHLMHEGIGDVLKLDDGKTPSRCGFHLRSLLFRGAPPWNAVARPDGFPSASTQMTWEPSPFWPWLYLRPALTPARLRKFEALAGEAGEIAAELQASATRRREELVSFHAPVRALGILVERLGILEAAKADYHAAALAQGEAPSAFRASLDRVAAQLERLRPGLRDLRGILGEFDEACGFSHEEAAWMDVHEESLDRHLATLRGLRPDGDSLLEFGEFLRRPATVIQRTTWR